MENMFVELGYVVKVYDGESYGEYAFSHIDENEIDTIAEEVKNHVMPWAKKLPDDMKVNQKFRTKHIILKKALTMKFCRKN